MRRQGKQGLAFLGCVIAAVLSAGCAAAEFEASAPDPGIPRISNFRIEPSRVKNGERVTLRFDFQDLDGDIMDVYLGVKAEIKDLTVATGLRPVVISRGRYFGLMEGTVEETIAVRIERSPARLTSEKPKYDGSVVESEIPSQTIGGIRVYEVFVVDRQGQMSNRLRGRVTVSPGSPQTMPKDRLGGVALLVILLEASKGRRM